MNSTTNELPAEIQSLIARVVKRTRLRKAERADIDRELAAHFRDGLASGKSVAQLVAAFGDAKMSARSIRAGALAKRSPLDRSLRQMRIAAGWMFLALLACYIASIGYLWMRPPVITFDPMERFRATLPQVAEQDRAWPVYKQGLLALADAPASAFNGLTYKNLGAAEGNALPNDPDWPAQREAMSKRRAGIDALIRATAMPALGYVPGSEPKKEDADVIPYDAASGPGEAGLLCPMYAILLPHMSILRQASRLLATDSLMAIEDGDGARFVDDIDAMIKLSHHTEEAKFLIAQLVGSAIRSKAFTQISMALEWRPDALSDEQLKRLMTILQAIPDGDYTIDLGMEQLGFADFIQRIYSDDGAGDGWFNPVYGFPIIKEMVSLNPLEDTIPANRKNWDSILSTLLSPVGAGVMATRKETLNLYSEMMTKTEEQSRLPVWRQNFSYEQQILQKIDQGAWAQSRWIFVRLLVPAIAHSARMRRLGETQSIAAQTAIALTLYRREHGGRWPQSLGELAPAYLPTAPLDPWTGQAAVYRVENGRVRVWSEGARPDPTRSGDEPEFANGPTTNSAKPPKWLWFLSGDKLERWKTQPTN